jgi:hypothetical protein
LRTDAGGRAQQAEEERTTGRGMRMHAHRSTCAPRHMRRVMRLVLLRSSLPPAPRPMRREHTCGTTSSSGAVCVQDESISALLLLRCRVCGTSSLHRRSVPHYGARQPGPQYGAPLRWWKSCEEAVCSLVTYLCSLVTYLCAAVATAMGKPVFGGIHGLST